MGVSLWALTLPKDKTPVMSNKSIVFHKSLFYKWMIYIIFVLLRKQRINALVDKYGYIFVVDVEIKQL